MAESGSYQSPGGGGSLQSEQFTPPNLLISICPEYLVVVTVENTWCWGVECFLALSSLKSSPETAISRGEYLVVEILVNFLVLKLCQSSPVAATSLPTPPLGRS